jgi:eukaryotic-like serine/threonine-protein kinase
MSYSPEIGKIIYSCYEIVKLLGSGGFGDTYLALDLGLPGKPQCVVKHLKPKDPNPTVLPIAKGLFQREAETLCKLGKPLNCDKST